MHTDQMADGRLAYEVVASVTHALPLFARAISPPRSSLAFSRSCYVEIYNWKTQLTQTISTQSEELDELVGTIIIMNHTVDADRASSGMGLLESASMANTLSA